MTKSQAINYLCSLGISGERIREVVKALGKEPKTDGDCISREKTLEKFCDYVGAGMSMNDFDALYDIVAKMPSVQPKTDILNKISAEIEQTAKDYDKFDDYRRVRGLWIALEIIDKYRQEG